VSFTEAHEGAGGEPWMPGGATILMQPRVDFIAFPSDLYVA